MGSAICQIKKLGKGLGTRLENGIFINKKHDVNKLS